MRTLKYLLATLCIALILSACGLINLPSEDPLNDQTFVLKTYNDQTPIDDREPTLYFEAGQISGTTGCNHYGGNYQVKGETIIIEGVYSTEMACLEPVGLMDQERAYLELLVDADQYKLKGSLLTLFASSESILVFEIQVNDPSIEPPIGSMDSGAVDSDVSATSAPDFQAPEGSNEYQDPITGISVHIPENWIVTGIIEGQYAILQSYPEDKYIGGERREEGDTKCDLNFQPTGTQMEELIDQWESDDSILILSEDMFEFPDGVIGKHFEIERLGHATVFMAEINHQVVLLTCYGDVSMVEDIAATLRFGR